MKPASVNVLGHELASISLEQAIRWVLERCRAGGPPALVVTLNPEIIVQAEGSPDLARALATAELTVADGVGVVWAASRAGMQLPGRVPGVELAAGILEAGGGDLSVFFLGARPGVAEAAAANAHARWGTGIAGHMHGYFDRVADAAGVARQIADSGAQLVLAGLGEGQELFLQQQLEAMDAAVAIGVGGTLDVLAGEVQRTPAWTRSLGIEWLWRVGLDRSRWHRFPRLLRFARLVRKAYPRGGSPLRRS